MKEKILLFVYNPKIEKFLLLEKIKHPKHAPKGGMFTINETIEKGMSTEAFIKWKLNSETGLNTVEILPLDWGSVYMDGNIEFKEMNFLVFTDSDKLSLNKKYSAYKWLNIEDFIRDIDWKDNRELLKRVLTQGINKEVYFDKKERGQ